MVGWLTIIQFWIIFHGQYRNGHSVCSLATEAVMTPKWFSSIPVLVALFILTALLWLVDLDSVQERPVLIEYDWYMWLTFMIQIPVIAATVASLGTGNITIMEADWSGIRWRRLVGKTLTGVAWSALSLSVAWTLFWLITFSATGSRIPVDTEQKFVLLNMVCMGAPILVLAFLGLRIGKRK